MTPPPTDKPTIKPMLVEGPVVLGTGVDACGLGLGIFNAINGTNMHQTENNDIGWMYLQIHTH